MHVCDVIIVEIIEIESHCHLPVISSVIAASDESDLPVESQYSIPRHSVHSDKEK